LHRLENEKAMSYLGPMRKTPFRRAATLVLMLAVMIGWSAQAFSLAMTGSCVAAMGDMDMGATAPASSSSDHEDKSGSMPCKGVALRCMNSLGCILSVALPQATFVVETPERFSDSAAARVDDLVGLSLKPELSPPIQMA
jgi:hypothetical protein